MGSLSRVQWSLRVIAFVIVLVALGVAFGFDWPFWVGALVGAVIALAQWRSEDSAHVARGAGSPTPH